ncbi:DUF3899 domain-containing protein [Paraclostridium ghonii]|uniref:DUF3899 domain-containing protein n=1 Tax=Paraclostridium ghonii TaxID=29358 RepID=A0ABU0N165_9FIRM|nr:DUF3899 domain-containing protein [Paeniclostridium ghonii]MDQ0556902.1 hypothetical protein [Paeniclostridium ghonii]
MKKFNMLVILNLVLSLSYYLLNDFERFSFINSSFIIGLFYLTLGIFLYVTEQGFFNLTIYAYSKVCNQIQKSRGLLSEEDIHIDDYIKKRYHFYNTNSLLSSGLFISLSTLIVSFIIY